MKVVLNKKKLYGVALHFSMLIKEEPKKKNSKHTNKRQQDDEADADLREAVDRAQPRRELDAALPGSH